MRTFVQKFGKSLMSPLSIIVAAGLLLGISSVLQNPSIFGDIFISNGFLSNFVMLINKVVGALFGLLPILFCISVAIGMSYDDKEIAGFSAVIGFVLFHICINFFLSLKGITSETSSIQYLTENGLSIVEATQENSVYETILGIFTYRMGVFGGIIVGIFTFFIHEKFRKTQLPTAFSFFSGKRFVPIVLAVTIPILALVMFLVWPYFSMLIDGFGQIIQKAESFGTFIYGFTERLLIPTGLHHILNQLIRFTDIGGSFVINGEQVSGALTAFNTLLMQQNPDMDMMREATKFLTQGTHPFMIFGLPAACYAMYKTSFLENKPKIKGILIASALTSLVTGITEPIEFAFIFVSPILYIFHAFMAGLSFFINDLLGVSIGNAGGGLIDFTIFGVLRGFETKWYINLIIGIGYAFIYYFVFKFVILKFKVRTVGREEDEVDLSTTYAQNDDVSLGYKLIQALGGRENIVDIDNCISRLRLVLNDTNAINENELKKTGSLGIIRIDDKNLQVIYGASVEKISRELKKAFKY